MSNGGTIVVRVQGVDIGLSDLLSRLNAQMAGSQGTIRNYATAMAQIDPATKAADQSLARYAQSLAAVAAKSGDIVGAQQILVNALQQITPATASANQVQAQLQGYLNQTSDAAERQNGSMNRLAAAAVTLRIGFQVATSVIREFNQVVAEGNQLEKTLTTFRVLSGSQQNYEKNLSTAREQQAKFGGSLNDTVEGMSEFANLSRRTGIEIQKLTNLARALAIVDPAQGFKGAGIALKELLAGGNITSLSRRFEIPREVLASIEQITDKKAQFDALTKALADFGISEELVTAQSSTTAVAFDKLSGAATDTKAAIGQFIAQAAQPFAVGLTKGLQNVANAFDALRTKEATLQGFSGRILEASSSYEQFNSKVQAINTQISDNDPMGGLLVHLQEITPAQYAYVQALVATGTSASDAFAKLDASKNTFNDINNAMEQAKSFAGLGAEEFNVFSQAIGSTAAVSESGAIFAQSLAQAVADGLPVEQAMVEIQQFKAGVLLQVMAAQQQGTAVTQDALQATQVFTQELNNNALEAVNSSIQTDALKVTQEQLYNAALAAAQGMGATASSAAALAAQFNITTQQAYGLISALQQLEVAKAKQTSGLSPRDFDTNAQFLQATKAAEAADKAFAAQQKLKEATQSTAQNLSDAERKLGTLRVGTEAYYNQALKVNQLQTQLDNEEKRRAKGGGAPKLTPNEKINVGLLDSLDKYNNKFEDAEQQHYDRLSKIYEDYAKKQDEQFRKNEVSKRRSRADFYSGLQDAPAGVDTQKFAAAYEEAFAKAQEIAQSGKAKLAADFLELRQKQIEELEKLAEDEAKIREQRKQGDITKQEEADAIAAIEGRKKLIQDAQDEEQKQLLAAGDENQNRLQEQLDAEANQYADQTDKIVTQSERAAQAKITHAERSKIAVDAENKSLADQESIYARIAAKNGGQLPKNTTPIPTTQAGTQNTSIDGSTTKPVNIEAAQPLPVSTQDILNVQQAATWVVQDVDVFNALGDLGVRLETKLSQVVDSIVSARDSITGAVNAVESAVGRIKLSSGSIVNG
jgi:hypothetical protein